MGGRSTRQSRTRRRQRWCAAACLLSAATLGAGCGSDEASFDEAALRIYIAEAYPHVDGNDGVEFVRTLCEASPDQLAVYIDEAGPSMSSIGLELMSVACPDQLPGQRD